MDWSGVDYCDVFIRLLFWRHPFTAEHPLLRHWCRHISTNLMKKQTHPNVHPNLVCSLMIVLCSVYGCSFSEHPSVCFLVLSLCFLAHLFLCSTMQTRWDACCRDLCSWTDLFARLKQRLSLWTHNLQLRLFSLHTPLRLYQLHPVTLQTQTQMRDKQESLTLHSLSANRVPCTVKKKSVKFTVKNWQLWFYRKKNTVTTF